tara:strand:- start:122 stop:613 length:492 start_codon:yes stop_codon:yes gene_type:complete
MHIHLTRTVVTLCLVIAMMIQPMLAFGAVAPCMELDCGQECLTCSGCGCCEIKQQGDECCCCSGSHWSAAASTVEASIKPNTEAVASGFDQVLGACHCGVASPPMNHDGQQNELARELALRVVLVQYLTLADLKPPTVRPRGVDSTPGSRADFSQRILCVWRI